MAAAADVEGSSCAAPKAYRRGTHRTISPAETALRMRPHFADLGITRVANVTGLDVVGIPTVMVTRPNGRSLSVHQGKGIDLDAARASGIMEAAEQHLAEHIERPLLFTTHAELVRRRRAVNVSRLPGYVRPFTSYERILWIEGLDLASGEPRWVPYEIAHLDLTLPLPGRSGFFPIGSNGLASGNHPLEAWVHGLCELVERDALALFYHKEAGPQAARRVDPATIDDGECRALLARYERAHVEVAIWDLTSDVGVATFLCAVVDARQDAFRPIGPARGSGCHPDRGVALGRALCEAAQSRLTRIAGARDDIDPAGFASVRADAAAETIRALAREGPAARSFLDVPTCSCASFDDEVRTIRDRLASRGMGEAVAVDLSRSELPCAVARMVVPGLEGVVEAPGYRPGPRVREVGR
jgi:ribosomal protein S12 methylthiotransferase accessory factor